MARAAQKLYTSGAAAHRINRQIDQFQLRIARFERRIKFVHANFPTAANQPAETETQINEPTVYITKHSPEIIKAGREQFPRSRIVVMPPGRAATGLDAGDDIPSTLRKAA